MSTEPQDQKLSALIDDELDHAESLALWRRIGDDAELEARWRRYSAISASLRAPGLVRADAGFVGRISDALKDEPTCVAPRGPRRFINERGITAALAASLAAVAIMVGKSVNTHSPMPELGPVAQNESPATQAAVDPRFRDYYVMHNETAYMSGAQGMLPYVRLASFKPAE